MGRTSNWENNSCQKAFHLLHWERSWMSRNVPPHMAICIETKQNLQVLELFQFWAELSPFTSPGLHSPDNNWGFLFRGFLFSLLNSSPSLDSCAHRYSGSLFFWFFDGRNAPALMIHHSLPLAHLWEDKKRMNKTPWIRSSIPYSKYFFLPVVGHIPVCFNEQVLVFDRSFCSHESGWCEGFSSWAQQSAWVTLLSEPNSKSRFLYIKISLLVLFMK